MAYIAKLKRGNDYIVTSSSETVDGCIEALVSFIKEESGEGDDVNLMVDDVEIEYTDIPYVFSAHRNWKGELVKIYGFTIERAREVMEKGGYSSLHLAYALVSDPRTPVEEKEAIFGFYRPRRGGIPKLRGGDENRASKTGRNVSREGDKKPTLLG